MKIKKLRLHRETLADLDARQLRRAGGGSYLCPSYTCYPGVCGFLERETCFTCEMTCTTNYC